MLNHVSSREERRAPEEIANRAACPDFERFKPLSERAESDLQAKVRETDHLASDASVAADDFFILGGQLVYVAEMGEMIKAPNGESDARLRVVYSNGTESNLLRRSLQLALYKDDAGRRLTDLTPARCLARTGKRMTLKAAQSMSCEVFRTTPTLHS